MNERTSVLVSAFPELFRKTVDKWTAISEEEETEGRILIYHFKEMNIAMNQWLSTCIGSVSTNACLKARDNAQQLK